jgi:carboxyl-terminal processing protease
VSHRPRTRIALSGILLLLALIAASPTLVAAQTPAPPIQVPIASEGGEAAGAAPDGGAAARSTRTGAVTTAGRVLYEAWDLLLDRFMDPLEPVALAEAAAGAMLERLSERGLSGDEGATWEGIDRAAAWARLADEFHLLAGLHPEVEPSALAHTGIAAMAQAAGDTHTRFMPPRQYQDHLAWARGEVKYEGVGIRLRGAELTIVEVFEGSPAAAAGLRPGDQILGVDGTLADDMPLERLVRLVRGPEGTPVTLMVQSAADRRVQRVTLVRAAVQVRFVETRVLDDIGYIRLRGFPEPSVVDAVEEAVLNMQARGARGIVLDLRGNSGGRVDVGTRLLHRFVPDGAIYQEVDRRGRLATRSVRAASPMLTMPLAVLIDEGTASMGELFAVNIQEHGIGRLFGMRTMGSVAASQILPLTDGSALQVSVMQILSGQGRPLNGVGVVPDEEVELRAEDLQSGRDVQLERAIGYLRESSLRQALPSR